ncbi:GNAT family N-acetyltransferase [Streptomyces sp. DT24]|uniref:GNAT family N-acetyltransferase n=1 Tax=unclassified Streptomyces TaxID=2593676 RepID=UPI0023B88612|nr:GNAT family N-acetyltransferase [Streptomyces sp. AM 4-1-1]WEH37089.1 GNAT family N-acetyltransferase [Streptomyces sp. AM 4-1-1]
MTTDVRDTADGASEGTTGAAVSAGLRPPDRSGTPGGRREAPPRTLDNPAWAALTGSHRRLSQRVGAAARYHPDVAPFVALADPLDPRGWQDLAALVGPGTSFTLAGVHAVPAGWEILHEVEGVQLIATSLRGGPDPEAVRLGAADVPEMLDLVARTRPGPFLPRTVELGAYHGIRRDGRLVAMAGERLRPPGWTEISAVCTDEAHRGEGLATRLVRHVADGIRERGDRPFLHTSAANTRAVRLYESLGFSLRLRPRFRTLRSPGAPRS